jgi:hypothetical protein
MNKIRIFSPGVLLSFAAGVFLLLSLGFTAWVNLNEASIDFGWLTLPQVSRPEPVVLHSSKVNAEGLAIYHQSERNIASPRANAEGLAIYHQSERNIAAPRANVEGMNVYHKSEWGTTPYVQTNEAGLDIYWQSERSSVAPGSIEDGMAIYLQSERNFFPADLGVTIDEGMAIYHASERGR